MYPSRAIKPSIFKFFNSIFHYIEMNRFEINFENTHILFFFSFEGIRINAIRLKHILYTEMEIPREITMAKTNKFPSNYSFHSNLSPVINISPNYMCLPKQRTNCKLQRIFELDIHFEYTPIHK